MIMLSKHHPKVIDSYNIHQDKWKQQIRPLLVDQDVDEDVVSTEERDHYRCKDCWLRSYDCYCKQRINYLKEKKKIFRKLCDVSSYDAEDVCC